MTNSFTGGGRCPGDGRRRARRKFVSEDCQHGCAMSRQHGPAPDDHYTLTLYPHPRFCARNESESCARCGTASQATSGLSLCGDSFLWFRPSAGTCNSCKSSTSLAQFKPQRVMWMNTATMKPLAASPFVPLRDDWINTDVNKMAAVHVASGLLKIRCHLSLDVCSVGWRSRKVGWGLPNIVQWGPRVIVSNRTADAHRFLRLSTGFESE
jgi:hypothetical protein